ncbi:RNA-binding protein [Ruminococcus flavefaciens]|uniref:YlmH family RNA-binding protein n=1 Tax=Ruminococcus flavefaciens TaxID=1265 RepID=UPI0002F3F884|nr:YlmH/Sll1252 family protein [Ruminococcus flavefaciens]
MTDQSDKLFTARLADLVSLCERDGTYEFSSFLDERQCADAEQWCKTNTGSLRYRLWGGYENARRRMLAVYPDYCEEYVEGNYPFVCLTFTYRREDKLTHRDFLGTFMGMQLRREVIGDIVVGEGIAQAFVTEVAAKLITTTVSKIGRVGVKITDSKAFELEDAQKFMDISGTVASLRLDCTVGLAAHLSREKAAVLIRSEKVDVNHHTVSSVSHELKEGDVLSVRGCGRFILSGINGSTKKGRIHINLRKYI